MQERRELRGRVGKGRGGRERGWRGKKGDGGKGRGDEGERRKNGGGGDGERKTPNPHNKYGESIQWEKKLSYFLFPFRRGGRAATDGHLKINSVLYIYITIN